MNEPNIPWWHPDEYEKWARENKKRADRLLEAAKKVWETYGHTSLTSPYELIELHQASIDYEDKRG